MKKVVATLSTPRNIFQKLSAYLLIFGCVLFLSCFVFASPSQAASLNTNLLQDGGGEEGGDGGVNTVQLSNHGWTGGDAGYWYAYGGSMGSNPPGVVSGQYFMGTYSGSTSWTYSRSTYQEVSSQVTGVSANDTIATLAGYIKKTGNTSVSQISLAAINASGSATSLGQYAATGSGWEAINIQKRLPADTVKLRVTLTATVNYGFAAFDDLTLKLTESVLQAPVISAIADQTIGSGATLGPLPFTISDADTALSSLTVSITADDWVIPDGNITKTVNTSTGSCTVSLTPAAGETGSVPITIAVSDGSKTTYETFTVTVEPNYIVPTLTATDGTPTFLQGSSSGVDLFSSVTAATNDSGQTFSGAVLTVSHVTDTTEYLNIGGTDVALTSGNSGTITGVGSYSVSVSGATATVTLSGMALSDSGMQTLIDGISYKNSASTVTAGSRVAMLTTITDSGSNNNSATINSTATVTVAPPPSSDATLKVTSTIKGQTVTSLGTPNAVLDSVAAGTVTITAVQAADTTNATTFVTLFDKNDATATITKVVKYASGANTSGFAGDAAYENTAISDNDFFIIQVTAADASVLYYKIAVTITPSGTIDECFIATAAYGSKYQPAVKILRRFRDEYLLTNQLGQAFVRFYYHNSPPIANFIAGNEALKGITRLLLSPFVCVVYLLYNPLLALSLVFIIAFLGICVRKQRVKRISI